MSSRNACYTKAPDLRLRAVPESGYCLVYSPTQAMLFSVNTSAWLVLELSSGRDVDQITTAFHHEVDPLLTREEAREQVVAALDDLATKQLVVVGGPTAD